MKLYRVEKLYIQNNMATIIECFHLKSGHNFDIQITECGKIFRDGVESKRVDKFLSIEKTLIKKINIFASVFHPDKFVDGYFASPIDADKPLSKDNIRFRKCGSGKEKCKKTFCYNNGKTYFSATIAAKELGLERNGVARVARGNLKHIKEFRFKYV